MSDVSILKFGTGTYDLKDKKAREGVENTMERVTVLETVMIERYREVGESDTSLVTKVTQLVSDGTTIVFDQNRVYELGEIPLWEKGLTLDFNGAIIKPNTTGVLFSIGHGGEHSQRTTLKNGNFLDGDKTPVCYIKIMNAINTVIDCKFSKCKATHSIIWNFTGYGTRVSGELRNSNAPAVIYLSHRSPVTDGYTFNFSMDADITANNMSASKGVYIEGGNACLRGVIENLYTGIYYSGQTALLGLNVNNVHFELNQYDAILTSTSFNQGLVAFDSCTFALPRSGGDCIKIGGGIALTVKNSYFDGKGVSRWASENVTSSWYTSIGNMFYSRGNSAYTKGFELADDIYNDITFTTVNGGDSNTNRSSINTLTMNNMFYLPVCTTATRPSPSRGGCMVFDTNLNEPIYWIGGKWYRMTGTNA